MSEERKLKPVEAPAAPAPEPELAIPKPGAFSLDKFKSKRADAIAGVETLLTALPHYRLADARDFVRVHPNEDAHWTSELCFVSVPIKGVKRDTTYLIEEDLAMRFLPAAKIQRYRLALATKPHDIFFLAHIPTRNLDVSWNARAVEAGEKAKSFWVELVSRKAEGVEDYQINYSRNPKAFPEPKWPTQSLEALVGVTFAQITSETDPGLLRLIGDKPQDE